MTKVYSCTELGHVKGPVPHRKIEKKSIRVDAKLWILLFSYEQNLYKKLYTRNLKHIYIFNDRIGLSKVILT